MRRDWFRSQRDAGDQALCRPHDGGQLNERLPRVFPDPWVAHGARVTSISLTRIVRRLDIRPIVIFAALLCSSGCDSNPFPMVKVSGKITYDDGTIIPAERIRIWFQSQAVAIDATTHPRPASALVNCSDGTFDGATSRKYQDGLVRGGHRVFIDITPAKVIPTEYAASTTSPLTISTDELPIHIKIPKPKTR